MHAFTKARMLGGDIYSFSNERSLCLNICSFRNKDTIKPVHLGLERNTAALCPVKECILAVMIHSNLIFILRRFTLTADA